MPAAEKHRVDFANGENSKMIIINYVFGMEEREAICWISLRYDIIGWRWMEMDGGGWGVTSVIFWAMIMNPEFLRPHTN